MIVNAKTSVLELVSRKFTILTGWSTAECKSKSWRMLQGHGADKAGWEQLYGKIHTGSPPSFELLKTSMKNNRSFVARIYAAGVCHISLNLTRD